MTAAADLQQLLDSLQGVDLPVAVDLSEVTFLDSRGVAPLVADSRRRQGEGQPLVTVVRPSRPALRLLTCTGLGCGPELDVAGWDALLASFTPRLALLTSSSGTASGGQHAHHASQVRSLSAAADGQSRTGKPHMSNGDLASVVGRGE